MGVDCYYPYLERQTPYPWSKRCPTPSYLVGLLMSELKPFPQAAKKHSFLFNLPNSGIFLQNSKTEKME